MIEKTDGKRYIIEIKPDHQTKPPVKKSRVTKSYLYECATFEINKAQWKAASEFAKDNGIEFQIMTENQIFPEKHYTRKNYGTRGVSRKLENRLEYVVDDIINKSSADDMVALLEVLTETEVVPDVGRYYTFVYQPKTPRIKYDQNPLIACVSVDRWGFRD